MNRPFAESAEQNKTVIFEALKLYLGGDVLEIGSGTGQHAVYFAGRMPGIRWQTSERAENLPGIESWIEGSGLGNLAPPIELDVDGKWPDLLFDLIYSANCLHIMGESSVAACIAGAGACLKPGGVFAVYGPFNYGGVFTSDSNASFDRMLRARDPASGIRDFEWVGALAAKAGLELLEDVAMPANNRSLIWQKGT